MMACSIKTKNWSARFIRRRCENCNMKAPPCKLLRVVRCACRYAYCCMFRDCVSSSSCGCGKHGTTCPRATAGHSDTRTLAPLFHFMLIMHVHCCNFKHSVLAF